MVFFLIKIVIGFSALTLGAYFIHNSAPKWRRDRIGPQVKFFPICGLVSIGLGTLVIALALLPTY